MLSKAVPEIPVGDGWHYEPKWDGFRCIVFRDGDWIELASRNEKPFTRYFPELIEPLKSSLPEQCVVDGEIVISSADGNGLDFDALLQRIHPAASRVKRLAAETPASFVAFDILAVGEQSLMDRPLSERLVHLETALAGAEPPIYLCPSSTDVDTAREWFTRFEGAGLDGVIGKRLTDVYTPDKRTLVKIKHHRTADCVVAGYRIHKDGKGVGSLLLGLFDGDGQLHHVGVTAAFTVKFRSELIDVLAPLLEDALVDHPWADWANAMAHADARLPGAGSRWNAGKDLSWVPVRPERVVEVTFGQLQNGRFRHGVQFQHWRPDRTPASCTYDQLDVAAPVAFEELMAAGDD
ncbi:MAG: lig [Ilumatobacteraceae bacterium]|nr:lig [Ilumatobacteraceae bacterium]